MSSRDKKLVYRVIRGEDLLTYCHKRVHHEVLLNQLRVNEKINNFSSYDFHSEQEMKDYLADPNININNDVAAQFLDQLPHYLYFVRNNIAYSLLTLFDLSSIFDIEKQIISKIAETKWGVITDNYLYIYEYRRDLDKSVYIHKHKHLNKKGMINLEEGYFNYSKKYFLHKKQIYAKVKYYWTCGLYGSTLNRKKRRNKREMKRLWSKAQRNLNKQYLHNCVKEY